MGRWLLVLLVAWVTPVVAQMVEVNDQGATESTTRSGAERARDYFKNRQSPSMWSRVKRELASNSDSSPSGKDKEKENSESRGSPITPVRVLSGNPRYLDIHLGTYFDDQAFKWGGGDQSNIGGFNAGVTYRLGEWINSADFLMRMDYMAYGLKEGAARKLALSGMVAFPDVSSRFPVYFGAGLGAGAFVRQIPNESALSIDYSLVAGLRFFDVIDRTGFMLESGLKNHLNVLSDGQFNGLFVNVGTVFNF